MKQFKCKRCGNTEYQIVTAGQHTGLYCAHCGAWQKWLNKSEKREYITSTENNENVGKALQSVFLQLEARSDYYGTTSFSMDEIAEIMLDVAHNEFNVQVPYLDNATKNRPKNAIGNPDEEI